MLEYLTLENLTVEELLAAPLAEEGEAGEAKEEDVVNPVLPDGVEMIYAAIFFGLLWLAMKALIPQINKARHEREAQIAAAKDAADTVDADMGSAQADYDNAIASARAEAAQILDSARAEVEADRAAQVSAVEAELSEARAGAVNEIEQAKATAMSSLQGDVTQVAVGAASTVMGKQLDVAAARPTVERILGGN